MAAADAPGPRPAGGSSPDSAPADHTADATDAAADPAVEAAEPDAGGRSTVGRLLTILEAVATTDGGVGVRALARSSGIDRSAVGRLLRQLTELGVTVADASGRYAIGPRLFAIAGAVTSRDELRSAARPMLEALGARFNETSYLAVLEDGHVVYRDVVESTQPLRYVGELGVPASLHAGAAGRAILAGLPDDAFEAWLAAADLAPITARTLTDPAALRERRAADRAAGFAVSRGERVPGGAAVAAPFVDAGGRVRGSIVVTCPGDRLPSDRERTIGDALVAMTARLGWRLGAAGGTSPAAPGDADASGTA